jgi:hypothetical protein
VAISDGQIGRHGHFLPGAQPEQGAVVAYAEPHPDPEHFCRPTANLFDQGQFAPPAGP